MLSLILLLLCASSFTGGSGSSINNIKICVSFDKRHMTHLNIGWDGSGNEVEIIYKTAGRNQTSLKYVSETRMITGLDINNASIGSNLTVQLAPVLDESSHNSNRSDPITIVVNYVHDVRWTRISANHIQFNCTLACRSAIKHCVVELNTTKNMSVNINKEDFSSWAIVDFFIPDTHQSFTYTAFAQGSLEILGEHMYGNIPSVDISTGVPNTTDLMNKSELSTTMMSRSATSSIHVTTTSILVTQGNTLSTTSTVAMVSQTTAVDKDENSSSTGLMVGVIITSLLVILLASMLFAVALILWRQKKGKTSEVSSTKHNTEGKDMQTTSCQGNGPTVIKDKNHIAINAYEEIVDVPVYSKPLSTSNPMFLQTERVKHSSVSSKKSLSSQRSFENFQETLPSNVFDEKSDHNRMSENQSPNNESHNHSHRLNKNTSLGPSNSQINFNAESSQENSASTEDDTKEQENPYFELVDLTTKNFYENASILPWNGQTSKSKEYKNVNTDSEKPITVCSKCQSLPLQGLGNRKSQPADEPSIKRRSLNDYDEPVKVDQVIDPTTGHTYTLPILRKKE